MKKNILMFINGFGVEQRDSYNVYSESLMPNMDKLTKTCLFGSLNSGDLDYKTGYRRFSIGIGEELTYSIVNNSINDETYKNNELFNYIIGQLNTNSSKLHVICYWDNENTFFQLVVFLKEIVTRTKIPVDVHLVLNQKSLNDYRYIEKSLNTLNYELGNNLKVGIVSGSNNQLLYKDFMKADIASDVSTYSVDKKYFISNVPYYITSPIILKLIDSNIMFDKIVMMVQKEVGERYSAAPGTKNYGAISVILQYFYDIKKEFVVSKNNFVPVPKVDSVIISFTPRVPKIKVDDINKFRKVVNDSFRFKRKTIKNNLSDYDLITVEKILNKYGYNLSSRAEEIPVEAFCEISMNI